MKKTIKSFRLILSGLIVTLFLSGCGGSSTSTNQYLGKLPGIAKKYQDKIGNKKKELQACTDLEKAFKLDKEAKILAKEADEKIAEYLAGNPITNIPFEQKVDDRFKIIKVRVERASDSRIHFKANVLITKDILNNWGNPPGFSNHFFAYVKAVNKEGNSLTRRYGVLGSRGRGPFKADMKTELYGSLNGPADLVNFEKLVFISKEDYNKKR